MPLLHTLLKEINNPFQGSLDHRVGRLNKLFRIRVVGGSVKVLQFICNRRKDCFDFRGPDNHFAEKLMSLIEMYRHLYLNRNTFVVPLLNRIELLQYESTIHSP